MKFKITLLALASAACLTACNDDFFDQVPDDRITIEQVFQRTSYSEKYLATVYSYILNEAHRTSPIPWDPCSDDLDVTYDREDYNSYQINLGNWSASSDYYEFWSHFYRGIRSATYFIQHIGDNQEMLNDPTRGPLVVEQYKNEARFLRAWFYYNLLRQYGPCVLLGDEVLPGDLDRDDVKMNLPRSSYDECVDYIVGELDDIIDNERLPLHFTSQADKDYGRATLAMCMGLKSRVLLLAASPQFNGNPAYANVVNTDGKRFVNEGAERDVLCKNIFAQPDGTYWVVVNTLRYPDPDEPDANGATINNMLALGHIVTGDTVEALAGEMGVDAANLQASIDAYNAVVEGGADEFGFVADNTADAAMTEGPWYACRKVPTVHHTMGGIKINVKSQVINTKGKVIPGLYAVGEVTGGIHGSNRLGGNAIADIFTFGRIAGNSAANQK